RHTSCYRDWSSDVCSSDLCLCWIMELSITNSSSGFQIVMSASKPGAIDPLRFASPRNCEVFADSHDETSTMLAPRSRACVQTARSEERRVGKECKFEWGAD